MHLYRMIMPLLFTGLLTAASSVALAAGVLIQAPGRIDMVHDAERKLIYITEGGNILRYHLPSASFLPPIVIGGELSGIDLSPDGTVLAVADRASSADELWVHLVGLGTLAPTKVSVPKRFYEGGMWTVAFAGDGSLITSSMYSGSMRRLSLATGLWTSMFPESQHSVMIIASGDAKVISFAETNNSLGHWGVYFPETGRIDRRLGHLHGTNWFNYEIATNRYGNQFAIPTYGGTLIYNQIYEKVVTLGAQAGSQPVGLVYHPVENLLYTAWWKTNEVRIHDTNTFAQVGAIDFEYTFTNSGNAAFRNGRSRMSRDGSLLMVSVGNGVRFVQLYSPLSAEDVTVAAATGMPVQITLAGAIGNNGRLAYSIVRAPVHGIVTLEGANATYTPDGSYNGSDSFLYRANYGRAAANAEVTIGSANRPPQANGDTFVISKGPSPTHLNVLGNDLDPDGDALSISAVTQPIGGSVSIDQGTLVFQFQRKRPVDAPPPTFSYIISDGRGSTATATVTLTLGRLHGMDLPVVPAY